MSKARKTKKTLISLLLSMSMMPAVMPVHNVGAATTNLFLEDFEGYAAGRVSVEGSKVYDSVGKQISGAIVTVVGDDYFEIVEENGNKYLKLFTKPNSSSSDRTRIQFEFGTSFSEGKKEISYKYKSVAHAASFYRMGVIYTDKNSPSFSDIKRFMSQGDNVIANKVNTQIFGYNSELSATKYTKGFGKVVQTIDYGSDTDNYTLSVTNDAKTYTKSFTVENLGTKAGRGICWDFSSNTINVNGKDAAIDGYGVYAFDDITVNDITLGLVSTSAANNGDIQTEKPFVLNFDENVTAPEVSIKCNGATMASEDYTVSASGKEISIIPVNGWSNGASYEVAVGKVTATSGLSWEGATYNLTGDSSLYVENFDSYATGRVKVEGSKAYDSAGKQIVGATATVVGDDYFEIVEENGNKYLKVFTKRNNTTTRTRIRFNFGTTLSGGTKEISYKYRSIAHYAAFMRMGCVYTDENNSANALVQRILSQGDNVMSKLGTTIFGWTNDLSAANYANGFASIKQTVNYGSDADNYTLELKHDKTTRKITSTIANIASKTAKGISWEFSSSDSGGANGKDAAIDDYGVYAFDDIKVSELELELTGASAENNSSIMSEKPFTLTFNENVTAPSVTVKCNGVAMATDAYTVSVNGAELSIMPVGGWINGAKYEVVIGKVTSASGLTWSGAAYNLTGNDSLFIEDFEGYEVGVIAQGTVDTVNTTRKPGELVYELSEGDKLEIVEKDGSKVLKLTQSIANADAKRRVVLDFDKHYGDSKAYEVSFDYSVENNSTWMADFGTLYNDNIKSAYVHSSYYSSIKHISSYRNNLYFDQKTDTNSYHGSNLLNSSESSWRVQSSKIDFSQAPRPYTVKSMKREDGTLLASMTKSVEKHADKETVPNQISAIAWETHNTKNSWMGQDEGDGVLYIDNITIRKPSMKFVSADIEDGATDVSLFSDVNLKFDENVSSEYDITVTENGAALTEGKDYSVVVEGKTLQLSPLNDGWKAGAQYVVSGTVSPSSEEINSFNGTLLTFTTKPADTSAPAIIWSSVPDGATHVEPQTGEITLRTAEVELDTVSSANVTITENGNALSGYSVENSGRYAVKISGLSLEKGAEYTVSVSGLKNKISGATQTEAYTISFKVREDIYLDAVRYVVTNDENGVQNVKVMATLWNKSSSATDYAIAGAVSGEGDKLLSVVTGSKGNIAAGGAAEVEISAVITAEAKSLKVFTWDGFTNVKPLTDKVLFNEITRTYGYDNYINNQPLKVGFIGGSITQQGYYTTPLKNYLNTILDADSRGGIKYIDSSKSGVGGTGSDLGIYRLEKDIIEGKPDIVFIEFAVNDGYETEATEEKRNARKKNIENLVRQLMELKHQPMVVMLDLTTKGLGENRPVIDDATELRNAYNIANVDVAKYIFANERTDENTAGKFVWTSADAQNYPDENLTVLTSDAIHPNADGGAVYAEYMNTAISANPENFFKKLNTVVDPLYADSYRNSRLVSWREAQYSGNWKVADEYVKWHLTDEQVLPQSSDATLTFEFTGTTIGLYMANGNKDGLAGSMEYSIDGSEFANVNSNKSVDYWRADKVIFSSELDADEVHTLTLRAKDVTNKVFAFGFFIVD